MFWESLTIAKGCDILAGYREYDDTSSGITALISAPSEHSFSNSCNLPKYCKSS